MCACYLELRCKPSIEHWNQVSRARLEHSGKHIGGRALDVKMIPTARFKTALGTDKWDAIVTHDTDRQILKGCPSTSMMPYTLVDRCRRYGEMGSLYRQNAPSVCRYLSTKDHRATLEKAVRSWTFVRNFYILRPNVVIFKAGDVHKCLLIGYNFHQNRRSASCMVCYWVA
jgi:hypothetical protein